MKQEEVARRFRIRPGKRLRIADHPTDVRNEAPWKTFAPEDVKAEAKAFIKHNLEELTRAQDLLYADDTYSVLIIFQAMDAAGKDGMIKHVMSGLNPQGCQVAAFKQPSAEELDHTFLWRYPRHLPERGRLGIFNRSYYEETLVVRVHPELLEAQKLPEGKRNKRFWAERFEDINNFEKHLARNGTLILKFFLNVSKEEQKQRFLERLKRPEKNWKFNAADLKERGFWKDYMRAYEETITATSTPWAPWYVIPADQKWVARAAVSAIISHSIRSLPLRFPKLSGKKMRELAQAKRDLLAEKK